VLYGHQKNCEREGRYEEAYFTKNKIEKYKKLVESKSKVDLKEKHKNEVKSSFCFFFSASFFHEIHKFFYYHYS